MSFLHDPTSAVRSPRMQHQTADCLENSVLAPVWLIYPPQHWFYKYTVRCCLTERLASECMHRNLATLNTCPRISYQLPHATLNGQPPLIFVFNGSPLRNPALLLHLSRSPSSQSVKRCLPRESWSWLPCWNSEDALCAQVAHTQHTHRETWCEEGTTPVSGSQLAAVRFTCSRDEPNHLSTHIHQTFTPISLMPLSSLSCSKPMPLSYFFFLTLTGLLRYYKPMILPKLQCL